MAVQIDGSQGSVIATSGDYSGGVSIGGTLTYEDVTNVDAVGLITARNGIEIGARPGVAASISVDGNMVVSGVSTFGDVSTFGGIVTLQSHLRLGDNDTIQLGDSQDAQIKFNATDMVVTSGGIIKLYGGNTGIELYSNDNSETLAKFIKDGACELYQNNTKTFETTATGATLTGDLTISDKIIHGSDTDTSIRFPAADQISFETGATGSAVEYLKLHRYSSVNFAEVGSACHLSLATNGANTRRILLGDSNHTNTGALGLQAGAGSEGYGGGIVMYSHANTTNAGGVYIGRSSSAGGSIIFGNGGLSPQTEWARFDSSGRLLIGVAASYANASIDELQIGNNNTSNQSGITLGSTDESAIAFADAGDARAGSLTYNHGNNMFLIKTDGQNTRFDIDNNQATFYPAITKSLRVRKNGQLDTANDQCLASFWSPNQTNSGDKGYISISSSSEGVYGCHVGFYNDGSNPGWLNPGFYVATGHNSYLPADHNIRFKISSNGNFYGSSTTISSISDARLKKNITNYIYDLNKFKQLQPKTFEWINPAEHCDDVKRGFSAQEVEAVDDYWILEDRAEKDSKDAELVDTDLIVKNSKLGELDAMYVSVINQLISKVETLESEVAALKSS